jgi:16S rRNA (cytidine1402-2'-O)-methyltransferase
MNGQDTSPPPEAGRAGLVLVATPIGNLGDLSPRGAAALRSADAIACEDTRHTRKLLAAAGIDAKRLLAVHEHNELAAGPGIVALIERGAQVALVTDAGMPAISDPGERIVAAVVAAGLPVTCVPGPSAVVVALALSGLPTDRFVFEGFLPRRGADRALRLSEVAGERRTVVLYEAPHRLVRTLTDLLQVCGGTRRCTVSRELTKHFEDTQRGTLAELVAATTAVEPRGEHVIVLEGATERADPVFDDAAVRALVDAHRERGLRTREAVDAVAGTTGLPRRRVYSIATD